jgi:hypothetical protein
MSESRQQCTPWIEDPVPDANPGFMLTAEQHRQRAGQWRAKGRPDLARQHGNVAKIIEARARKH